MIIGTAGHIDHGKTTLVRALTGVDTDRLPEEKRRGISIELGYAYLQTDDVSLGFVDVPGHERLLHTMLAGATGIDHALLVVAADDGVMPQTREHLAVVALLGLTHGTVAITKIDRVAAADRTARIAEVQSQIDALLAPTPLAGAPMFALSGTTGEGLPALREHLVDAARSAQRPVDQLRTGPAEDKPSSGQALLKPDPAPPTDDAFRLAVDRCFTLAGIGTVVTGAVFSGTVRLGDELLLMPGQRSVRVRGIHAQNLQAEVAHAGQRCALALAGIAKDAAHRGDWVCAPAIALATARIDIELTLWPDEAQPLRSGSTVHVHLGTSDVMASVALLDRDTLAPGATALAQLVLRSPVSAWHNDRGVLRDASATRTLGGVRVLDPFAPTRYRRTPERLQALAAWQCRDRPALVASLLASAPLGLDTDQLTRSLALVNPTALPLPDHAVRFGPSAIARPMFEALQQRIVERLTQFHAAAPNEVGPDARRLKRLAAPRTSDALWRHAIESLLMDSAQAAAAAADRAGSTGTPGAPGTPSTTTQPARLARSGTWLHLPAHAARLSATEERLAQKLLPMLLDGAFDPPWVRDLALACSASEATMRQTLASLARRGQTFQVVKDLYYPQSAVEQLARLARDCIAGKYGAEGLQAASFRDATGLGRKRAIQLLEFFDRVGYTRRVKDVHLLRPDTVLFGAGDQRDP